MKKLIFAVAILTGFVFTASAQKAKTKTQKGKESKK